MKVLKIVTMAFTYMTEIGLAPGLESTTRLGSHRSKHDTFCSTFVDEQLAYSCLSMIMKSSDECHLSIEI